jgi:hypothetical protein
MPHITDDKIDEARERIIKFFKEAQEEESKTTFVMVKTKTLHGLSTALSDATEMVENETAKEILLTIKAGLDWIVENRVISPEKVRTLKQEHTP